MGGKKCKKNKVAAHTSILIKSTDSVPLFINFARSRLVHISAQLGPNLHEEIISCSERMKWTSEFDGWGLTRGRCMALQWPMETLPV